MSNTRKPERIRDFHDDQTGLSVWCADDGTGTAWLEIETSDGTLKLTAAQAAVLDSERLSEAIPNLRGEWFWRTRGQATTADLAGRINAIKAAREPVKPQPTREEQAAARRAREDRISTAEYTLQKATDAVGWSQRHRKMASELGKELNQARALDAGLDLTAMEEEHEKVTRWAAVLPEHEAAAAAAKAEVKAAYAWDGFKP